ncbi:MAG: hypothetical protein ABR505_05330 [Actinomycetota bacterium]
MRSARALFVVLVALACLVGSLPSALSQEDERTHASTNFSITWTTDEASIDAPDPRDADADGVPDGIESMLAAFEASRTFLVQTLGYKPPPVEGPYQLYVAQSQGVGFTRPAPGGTGRARASLIVIPPRLVSSSTSEVEMQTFAVHEYFHAIQLGYDADENHWIREASSTWVQDLFLDEHDTNHHLLRNFVPTPRRPLDSVGGEHEYGAFLFLQFLTERYGGGSVTGASLIRELWEEMAVPEAIPGAPNRGSLDAIESVLARRGVSMGSVWGEFLLWRWRLVHFEEGAAYRAALAGLGWPRLSDSRVVGQESCRLTLSGPEGGLPPWAGDYVRLTPDAFGAEAATAVLAVEGPPGSGGFVLLKRRRMPVQEILLTFDATGHALLELPFGSREVRRATVGGGYAHVPDPGAPSATIAYSLRLAGRSVVRTTPPVGTRRSTYGTGAQLSGEVTCAGEPAPLADVEITEREVVSGATRTFLVTTDDSGRWSLGVTPQAHTLYTARAVDPLLSQPPSAGEHRLNIEVFVSLVVAEDRVPIGEPVTLSGEVAPAHPGVPLRVEFRRPERAWREGPELVLDSLSRYAVELQLPRPGFWEIRARVLDTGDADHLTGISAAVLIELF